MLVGEPDADRIGPDGDDDRDATFASAARGRPGCRSRRSRRRFARTPRRPSPSRARVAVGVPREDLDVAALDEPRVAQPVDERLVAPVS
jgi:hypothetical protein